MPGLLNMVSVINRMSKCAEGPAAFVKTHVKPHSYTAKEENVK